MISAVSNSLSFHAGLQDLINSPGQFSNVVSEKPSNIFVNHHNTEEKKTNYVSVIAATILTAIGVVAGLGYAVRNKHLEQIDVSEIEGSLNKLWARCKNTGFSIGEFADKNYNKVFNRK